MATKATIRQYRYDKAHCKNYHFKLNNEIDSDLIEKLASVPSMQGYLKQLIRADMNGNIAINLSQAALDMLKDKAAEQGVSAETLAAVIISERLIRT